MEGSSRAQEKIFLLLKFLPPSFQMLLNSADYCKQISSFSHIFCVGTMLTYAKYDLLLKYALFLQPIDFISVLLLG